MQAAALVENIIDTLELDAEEIVDIGNVSRTLREWLDHHRELTHLTRPFLNAHAQLADNDELRHLRGDDSRDSSEERRVGKEWGGTGSSRGSRDSNKTRTTTSEA